MSGASPFPAACGAGEGTAFVGAEVEPSIAVNPRDEGNLVAVWQQDRWSNGAARGLLSAASFDGGATWTAAAPAFSQCTGGHEGNGGDFLRATDPWVAFGPDGIAYQSALVLSGGSFTAGSSNAMRVSRSADGGRTWSTPTTLILDGGEFFNDKETVTADPTEARFAYVVWDRLQRGGHGPTWLARTTDGGLTWEPARMIHDPGAGAQTVGNLVRVLPGGTLVNVFMELRPANGNTAGAVRILRSGDRGLTWSAPITVSNAQPLGARDPTTGLAIRDGSILPQMAVGPDGALHVVWQDGRFTGGRDGIAYARSTDGGLTW
ncbi:MAG TPA: sialidase family protein, partial [Gemmatimonadales bacterium]|nr:sialidase family protein [Gemmatimonadales bacterium]